MNAVPLLPKEILEKLKELPHWQFETGILRKVTFSDTTELLTFLWNVSSILNNLQYTPFEMKVTQESISFRLQKDKATTPCLFDFVCAHAIEALIQGEAAQQYLSQPPSI